MKIKICCAILTFLVAASLLSESNATNSTWGYRRVGDYLLYREFVIKGSHWLRVVEKDVSYPPKGFTNYNNISAIYAIDHARKDGGYARLLRGGPGYRNATLRVKSERSYGLNFTIEFYGR